jgi:hypothetical protein
MGGFARPLEIKLKSLGYFFDGTGIHAKFVILFQRNASI